MSLPSQEGSGLKLPKSQKDSEPVMSSLARGKWIEATVIGCGGRLTVRLPSQEGSGLKLAGPGLIEFAQSLPSQEGSGLKHITDS